MRASLLLLLALLTGGCSLLADDEALATSDVDVARAERAWRDPWLAPTASQAPTFRYGSDDQVDRDTGTREAGSSRTPYRAATLEIGAATRLGWRLVGARCEGGDVTAWLARGEGLDGLLVGVLTAVREEGSRPWTRVTVTGRVPHHADGSAPRPGPALPVRETCVGGGTTTGRPLLEEGEPRGGDDAEDGPEVHGWGRDDLSDDEAALVTAVEDDAWFSSVGGDLSEPDLRTGDRVRFAAQATGRLPVRRSAAATVARTVRAMAGWELTWTACTEDYTLAALRRVTPYGVATAHLEVSTGTGAELAWAVRLPAPESDVSDWVTGVPVLSSSRCLDPAAAPAASLVIEGQPVSVPVGVQPLP